MARTWRYSKSDCDARTSTAGRLVFWMKNNFEIFRDEILNHSIAKDYWAAKKEWTLDHVYVLDNDEPLIDLCLYAFPDKKYLCN
jgi:hypothetical protein